MKQVEALSPVAFKFMRKGGADIQAETQIWIKKDDYGLDDRPVFRVKFSNPLASQEVHTVELPMGTYVCVLLGMAREALNGAYRVQLEVKEEVVFQSQGDANTTPKPGDIVNFRSDFELKVKP